MNGAFALAVLLLAADSQGGSGWESSRAPKPEPSVAPGPIVTDLAPLPARSILIDAPDSVMAETPFRVRVHMTDSVGRPVRGDLPRPVFASSLGVEPVLGRGVWQNGMTEEWITLGRPGLGRILAVRVDDLGASKRLDVLPSPRSRAALLAEAEERLAADDPAGALVSLRAAAEIGSPTPEIWMRLGEASIRVGRWDEARAAFRRALDLTVRKAEADTAPVR